MATKFSVLFFYHRIFFEPRFKHISILIGVMVLVWFLLYTFLQFFSCTPLAYHWDKTIHGHCIDRKMISYYGYFPLDILTNILILILPIPYLWKLQMERAKKVAVIGIFVLGSLYVPSHLAPYSHRTWLTVYF